MWSNISSPPKSQLKVKREEEPPPINGCSNTSGAAVASASTTKEEEEEERGSPLMRYKHAVCSAPSGYIYIHGGRFGNLPLDDDVWRFDPHQNSWLQLETRGERPPSLQEHTLVEHNERLYLFGGQVSAANCEISFWRLDLVSCEWRSLAMKSSKKFGAYLGPTNRRGHSAIIYGDSMYIFGGFEDFRGSSAQLWEFDLINQRWELRNLSASSACHPEPRHSHSAIVYNDSMFIYGGLSNLKPLGDLWRWSWREKRWFKERTRGNSPGHLHGHTAIQAFGSMFVFGGERNGRTTRSLWRLNLANLTWRKIRPKGPRPSATTWHCAIANPLSILDEANYIIEGDSELIKNEYIIYSPSSALAAEATFTSTADHNNNNSIVRGGIETKNRPEESSNRQELRALSHSQSSSADMAAEAAAAAAAAKTQQLENRKSKRKSGGRLSFLRPKTTSSRHAPERPRSTFPISASAITGLASQVSQQQQQQQQTGADRHHSICVLPAQVVSGNNTDELVVAPPTNNSSEQMNAKILDNLDTDIKQMFQAALSSDQLNHEDVDQLVIPMSVDAITAPQDQLLSSEATSRSQYQTAFGGSNSFQRSQRTSYAPSESLDQHTLRDSSSSLALATNSIPPPLVNSIQQQQQRVAGGGRNSHYYSVDRRNNRPKSEIVQSLIDRADARIRNHYEPFLHQTGTNLSSITNSTASKQSKHYNYSGSTSNRRSGSSSGRGQEQQQPQQQQQQQQQQLASNWTDKSKRHTIHQTMTYYNLYFSEDKSSSSTSTTSPPSDQQQQQQQQQRERENATARQATRGSIYDDQVEDEMNDDDNNNNNSTTARMVRDDELSSSTIKGNLMSSGAALIGVHGIISANNSQVDQQNSSQLSLEASSESRTLCGIGSSDDTATGNKRSGGGGDSGEQEEMLSSLPNAALTSRTTTNMTTTPTPLGGGGELSGGDNTSLSFSVIAEFEEDDMLQYSSPTDPVMMLREHPNDYFDDDDHDNHDLGSPPSKQVMTEQQQRQAELVSFDAQQESQDLVAMMLEDSNDQQQQQLDREQTSGGGQQQHLTNGNHQILATHKSASSGYDSISGFEQSENNESNKRMNVVDQRGGGKTTHEDSSMRTESSLGGCSANLDTSPEQSAQRKQDNKSRGMQLRGITTSRCGLFTRPNLEEQYFPTPSNINHHSNGCHPTEISPKMTNSSTTADSLVFTSDGFDVSLESSASNHVQPLPSKSLPPSSPPNHLQQHQQKQSSEMLTNLGPFQLAANSIATQRSNSSSSNSKLPLVSRARLFGRRNSKKNRYWQLCMFVIGGKQGGIHGMNEPITIWRLYI